MSKKLSEKSLAKIGKEMLDLPIGSCSLTISLEDLMAFCSHLEGEILTIAEASMGSNKEQLEAIKSLIRKSIRSNQNIVSEWHWKQGFGKGSNFPFPKVRV